MTKKIVYLLLVMASAQLSIAQPNWSINPRDYVHSMTVIAQLNIDCAWATSGVSIAVFNLDGDLRGVTTTQSDGYTFITIHNNTVNEQLVFKYYHADLDSILYISHESIAFIPDMIIGSIASPMLLYYYSDSAADPIPPLMQIHESSSIQVEGVGSGYWQILTGQDGYFMNKNESNTTFHGSIGQAYLVSWTQVFSDSCLNQSSYGTIYLVKDSDENILTTCQDGLDNDGDGLIDCQDPDCARPVITRLDGIPPSTQSCTTTDLNGLITIEAAMATTFVLNAMRSNSSGVFDALDAGTHFLSAMNEATMCSIDTSLLLPNTKNFYAENGRIELDCELHADTILNIETSGGTAPLAYVWRDSVGTILAHNERIGSGIYTAEVTDYTGCVTSAELAVVYNANKLDSVDFYISGPKVVCPLSTQVHYALANTYGRDVNWTLSGQGSNIGEIGPSRIAIDFMNDFNAAVLTVSTSNHCSVKSADLSVELADPTLCQELNDCSTGLELNEDVLRHPAAPQYYATRGFIRLGHAIVTKSIEFSTKDYFEIMPNVEFSHGINMELNFNSCQKE